MKKRKIEYSFTYVSHGMNGWGSPKRKNSKRDNVGEKEDER